MLVSMGSLQCEFCDSRRDMRDWLLHRRKRDWELSCFDCGRLRDLPAGYTGDGVVVCICVASASRFCPIHKG